MTSKITQILIFILIVIGVTYFFVRMDYPWHWEVIPPDLKLFFKAALLTLKLSVASILFGTFIGLFTGLGRISKTPLIYYLSTLYVEVIRNIPLLVTMFIVYFAIAPTLKIPAFTSGVVALSIFVGAYVAEIFRAGIQSIGRGQTEAARSLGMSYVQAMRYVILPQAVRRILPPLAGEFISLVKDSSLASVMALPELTLTARQIMSRNFRSFEVWLTTAIFYLVMTLSLSMIVKYLERRMRIEHV